MEWERAFVDRSEVVLDANKRIEIVHEGVAILGVDINCPRSRTELLAGNYDWRSADLDRVVICGVGITHRCAEVECAVRSDIDIRFKALGRSGSCIGDETEGALQSQLLLDIVPLSVEPADIQLKRAA